MSKLLKFLRSRESGCSKDTYESRPYDVLNKIVAKPLQLTTDPQLVINSSYKLVIKVYVKIIEMKDQKGQITKFLCWMSNKVIGDLVEMWPKIDKDEFISTLFRIYFDNVL